MKMAASLFSLVVAVALTGCTAHDYVNDHKWTIEAPKDVQKGTEFPFKVLLVDANDKAINGVDYHYQIHWPGGTVQPLRHAASTGEDQKRRASLVAGTATLVVTCGNKEGASVKVAEASLEIK